MSLNLWIVDLWKTILSFTLSNYSINMFPKIMRILILVVTIICLMSGHLCQVRTISTSMKMYLSLCHPVLGKSRSLKSVETYKNFQNSKLSLIPIPHFGVIDSEHN